MHDVTKLFLDESYIYHSCADRIIHRCVLEVEMFSVLKTCHSSPIGVHHNGVKTAHNIVQSGFYWHTIHQDAHDFAQSCDSCQREGGIWKRQEIPMNPLW